MRLWTLHPRYLDSKGLVAAWREGLLAQKVLAGKTRGYRHHPQLIRFRESTDPLAAIAAFLAGLATEADGRGYHFDSTKIAPHRVPARIPETRGQLLFEWTHLQAKLRRRSPLLARRMRAVRSPEPHPLFRIVRGGVRPWEKP
jgi:Pyrimidine dimer DNA glycosylase